MGSFSGTRHAQPHQSKPEYLGRINMPTEVSINQGSLLFQYLELLGKLSEGGVIELH